MNKISQCRKVMSINGFIVLFVFQLRHAIFSLVIHISISTFTQFTLLGWGIRERNTLSSNLGEAHVTNFGFMIASAHETKHFMAIKY